ncbi:MAG: hypothetical protein U0Y68_08645 [Blastocatellia bacterium]
MQRRIYCGLVLLSLTLFACAVFAQEDKLSGRWEGKTSSPQGERDTVASFKKEGNGYAGTITGMRGDQPLKDIKVDGNKVTAKAEVQTPQATLTINYTFTLEGDGLKGKGALDFNGTPFEFDVTLKRAGGSVASSSAAAPAPPANGAARSASAGAGAAAGGQRRQGVAQPQQKQSLDYFVGAWNFKFNGRDSALGFGVREGTVTFTKNADGKSVTGNVAGTNEKGAYKETITISFDEATKALVTTEKLANGATVNLKGDWSSPIAIRSTTDAVKIKGQTIKLRRTLSIIAAHSFSILDELSEDDGPFVRLGNALFARVEGK